MKSKGIRIGIDASNLNMGGGRSHIINILENYNPNNHNIEKITIYGTEDLLEKLPAYNWLEKKSHSYLNRGLLYRYIWLFFLSKSIFKKDCDILFNPSGLYIGLFKPYVTMSRNMMLFDKKQLNSQKGLLRIKLWLSRQMNIHSIKRSTGVIFISEYAKSFISKELKIEDKDVCKINHGISDRFRISPQQRVFSNFELKKIKLLYVSHVYSYKHPWNVVKAVQKLKEQGFNVSLDLVGGGDINDINHLHKVINESDPLGEYIKYQGNQPYNIIHNYYKNADIFVYASTCENMPNILLEAMSASLPIACSEAQPMPEFLENAGEYFNAKDVSSIVLAIKNLVLSEQIRIEKGSKSFELSLKYNWEKTSFKTFEFIEKVFNSSVINR